MVVEQQAKNSQDEGGYREIAQEVDFGSRADPQEHGRFDQPADGDPLSVEFQGNGDGDEGDGDGHVKQIEEDGVFAGKTFFEGRADAQIDGAERQREPGEGRRVHARYMA